MSQELGCAITTFGAVCLAIFLGVFFGCLYPEIVINKDSIQTSCLITNSTINSFYCPSVSCTSCTDSSGLDSCGDVSSYMESFDPTKCSVNNTQACPTSPQSCSNGYKCCQTCCQTCTSCSTSCSSSSSDDIVTGNHVRIQSIWKAFSDSVEENQCSAYSKGSVYEGNKDADNCVEKASFETEACSTSCSSYPCNCYCCNSVSNLLCTITADVCYNADLFINYDTINDALIHTQYIQQFGTDLTGAQNYIQNEYQISHSYICYYDTTDLSTVRWNIAYSSEYIEISSVFGAVSFTCFVIGIHMMLRYSYNETNLVCIESVIWLTLFVPLIILVPILTTAPLSKTGRAVVVYFICQLTTLGLLPTCISGHWTYGIVYIFTIYLGIGIIVPSEPFIQVSNIGEFYGVTIGSSIMAFVFFMWILHNAAQIQAIMTNAYLNIFNSCQCWTLKSPEQNNQSAPPAYNPEVVNQPPSYESTNPPSTNKA
jgi:hypothetical protein